MNAARSYAVILQAAIPEEFLAMLKDFVMTTHSMSYLISSTFEESIHFAKLTLVRKGHADPWQLRIPMAYILAVAEIENKENPLGIA